MKDLLRNCLGERLFYSSPDGATVGLTGFRD